MRSAIVPPVAGPRLAARVADRPLPVSRVLLATAVASILTLAFLSSDAAAAGPPGAEANIEVFVEPSQWTPEDIRTENKELDSERIAWLEIPAGTVGMTVAQIATRIGAPRGELASVTVASVGDGERKTMEPAEALGEQAGTAPYFEAEGTAPAMSAISFVGPSAGDNSGRIPSGTGGALALYLVIETGLLPLKQEPRYTTQPGPAGTLIGFNAPEPAIELEPGLTPAYRWVLEPGVISNKADPEYEFKALPNVETRGVTVEVAELEASGRVVAAGEELVTVAVKPGTGTGNGTEEPNTNGTPGGPGNGGGTREPAGNPQPTTGPPQAPATAGTPVQPPVAGAPTGPTGPPPNRKSPRRPPAPARRHVAESHPIKSPRSSPPERPPLGAGGDGTGGGITPGAGLGTAPQSPAGEHAPAAAVPPLPIPTRPSGRSPSRSRSPHSSASPPAQARPPDHEPTPALSLSGVLLNTVGAPETPSDGPLGSAASASSVAETNTRSETLGALALAAAAIASVLTGALRELRARRLAR